MLDPWIIDEIRRREEEQKEERPVLELPLEMPVYKEHGGKPPTTDEERGVVIVEFGI